MSNQAYAEVGVHLPIYGTFHYEVPRGVQSMVAVGSRVLVPFGGRGVSGIVLSVDGAPPTGVTRIKAVSAVVDPEPVMSEELVALCRWIARYYEAPVGEVLRNALPVGGTVSGKLVVELTEAGRRVHDGEGGAVSSTLRDVLAVLAAAGGSVPHSTLAAKKRQRDALRQADELGLTRATQQFGKTRVREVTEKVATLTVLPTEESLAGLGRAPARRAVLEAIVAAAAPVPLSKLRSEFPRVTQHAKALADAGFIAISEVVKRKDAWARLSGATEGMNAPAKPPVLNDDQAVALEALVAAVDDGEYSSFLLHGVTGSGKTEVYLGAISRAVAEGGSAIVLVPEISLTPLLAARFRARFGDKVAVLHSGLTDRERFDEWYRLREGIACIAVGARSAVFSPVRNLRIIVVDEEHDSSFKQEEGVRYHARDVALVRATGAQAVCVLGSATPSFESFELASGGKHTLLSLPRRATPKPLPVVSVVDLRKYSVDKDTMLSAPLVEALESTLERGEQSILFLNRRGFETFIVCTSCGFTFRCEHCSVSLTYHRGRDVLACHHCGYERRRVETCPECNVEGAISRNGIGTEKVAAALSERFADATVLRIDRDVGRNVQNVLGQFTRGEGDILVGTQMVTKGHDFPRVTFVGVLVADTSLTLPDFRAAERTFQLLTQVAGRAGRGEQPGRVLVQTYRPEADAVRFSCTHDYMGFFQCESEIRKDLGNPPFGYLVAVRVDGTHERAVQDHIRVLRGRVRTPGVDVLGPCEAPLARLGGRHRWHMWLRGDERRALRDAVHVLAAARADAPSGVRVVIDVDPVSAL